MRPTSRVLLEQLAAWCEDALDMAGDGSLQDFRASRKSQYATAKCIEGVGETARRILQEYPEFAGHHPALPLAEAYRMRNRLAHGYERVNIDMLWNTAVGECPSLARDVRAVLMDLADDQP